MEKKSYTVKIEGWLDGTYRLIGDVISMSSAQAEHLLIVGSIAETVEAEPAPAKGEKTGRTLAAPEAAAE